MNISYKDFRAILKGELSEQELLFREAIAEIENRRANSNKLCCGIVKEESKL